MTTSQKLAIRSSEIRQRLNEIAGLETDAVTDAIRAESEGLRTELGAVEVQYRAALTTEGAEEHRIAGDFDNGDGEPAEVRALLSRVGIGDYLRPAVAGIGLSGAPVELASALKVSAVGPSGGVAVPWTMLAGPEHRGAPERRAFTTTAQNDGPLVQRPILQRLFGMGIMDALGVRIDSVPTGMSEWPIITAGAAPDEKAEGTAATDAVVATIEEKTLKPKRLTGEYEFTHEIAASVPGIEAALRRDLADAVMARMSAQIIDGDGTGAKVRGFNTAIAAPSDAGATAVYADYAGAHALAVDGIHATMETEVTSVIGVAVYQHAAGVYQAGSGESGSEALRRRGMRCMASPYVGAAANTGQHKANFFHAAGPNGGAMRGDSIAAVWPTLEIVRDIYSQASVGVVLTWISLWDAYTAFRPDAYKRLAFDVI